MDLSGIVAINHDRLIGNDGHLPWQVPEDLKNFQQVTRHKILVMGHRTFKSLPKPLRRRYIAVLSSQSPINQYKNVKYFSNPLELLAGCKMWASELNTQVMVAGGQAVYALFEPWITSIHLTIIDIQINNVRHPTYFPIDWQRDFKVKQYRRLSSGCIYLFLERCCILPTNKVIPSFLD